jgi:DNA-binding NtrC family response regulator
MSTDEPSTHDALKLEASKLNASIDAASGDKSSKHASPSGGASKHAAAEHAAAEHAAAEHAASKGEAMIRISVVSRDTGLAEAIGRTLGAGFTTRASAEFEINRIGDSYESCDVMLLDLRPASTRGNCEAAIEFMDAIQNLGDHPPIVVLCDSEDRQLSADVNEHGAYDVVNNPPNIAELRQILQRAHKAHAAEQELRELRASVQTNGKLHELLGTSQSMQELFGLAQKIAPCDVNVLITGETGTGKELLARAIHQMSGRSGRPLVAFSCVNLPDTLIEDELFGHEKGAFTGALMSRRGRLETADQGTLFLDEIGDLGLSLQPKLLRVLQQRSFERLGSNTAVNVNIRLICATHRNLGEMVQKGTFREDLFYRLNVVQMHLPALRERRDDIPLLAQHFLRVSAEQFGKRAKRFSQSALRALEEYTWPGNVRELENVVQRAVVLSEAQTVDLWHLPAFLNKETEQSPLTGLYEEEVRQFKKRLLLRTLQECGWRKAESARVLGVARGYLHRLINQLDIREPGEAPVEVAMPSELPPFKHVM